MDFGAFLTGSVFEVGLAIVAFIGVLSVIVFVHEYGHFKTARLCGVRVETFSIGFGRSIGGFVDRYGTYWKIGWLPLGGYVKFAGDANAASMPSEQALAEAKPGDFHTASLWRRALIVVAGPMANFVLAIVVFALMFMLAGIPITQPKVASVVENSAASEAGFLPGDLITEIDGRKIESFTDVQRIVSVSAGTVMVFKVDREGRSIELTATPESKEIVDPSGNKIRIGLLGVSRGSDQVVRVERLGLVASVSRAVDETWFIITRSLSYLKGVVIGNEAPDQLSGPIKIAQIAGEAASISAFALIQLVALLSVSIGLINLFPIPMLDGGHLMYYFFEAVRGKPLGPQAQEFGYKVGFALVIALMVFATWNDLT
ncbi:MAG: RIP metalloprotease RseP [Anderseniella sp.]